MYYVAKAKNHEHAKNIFNWGWNNRVQIVSWPSFYKKHKLNKNLYKRWKKYICFPLNQEISIINEEKFEIKIFSEFNELNLKKTGLN